MKAENKTIKPTTIKQVRLYKVIVLGENPKEVVASSPDEAVQKANVPKDWEKNVSGEVITVFPRIRGGAEVLRREREPGEKEAIRILLKHNINFYNRHGSNLLPEDLPKKTFVNWCVAQKNGVKAPYTSTELQKLLGYSLDRGQRDFLKSEKHDVITLRLQPIEVNGEVVASFDRDNKLFLCHFDLTHSNNPLVSEFINKIVLPAFYSKIQLNKLLKEQQKNFFVEAVTNQINNTLKDKKDALNTLIEQEEQLLQQLTTVSRTIDTLTVEIDALEKKFKKDIEKRARREYDAVMRNKLVESVNVEDNRLIVYTKPIIIEGVNIGRFQVIFKNSNVKFKNLDFPDDKYLHPHIKSSGACWGNIKEHVFKLLKEYEYAAAVNLVLSYLQSYNESDSYKKLEYFSERCEHER